MKLPNINCKNYTTYGKCKVQKGRFFLKICPLSRDFSLKCDIQEPYPKPAMPPKPPPGRVMGF